MVVPLQRKFELFGLNYTDVTLDEAVKQIEKFIRRKMAHMVFTMGAELIVRANCDEGLREIYLNSDMLTVDSMVVYFSAKLLGKPLREPVNAVRLMFKFLKTALLKSYHLYFLGAREEVVKEAVENVKSTYSNIKIVGWHDGYFSLNNDAEIVNEIKEKKADVLFVAMSSPLKEKFISKNLKELNVPVCIGVGGSFDILAGVCKLAPKWVSKIGLEWFYRLIQEPKRLWKRYLVTNSIFIWLVLKEFIKQLFKF